MVSSSSRVNGSVVAENAQSDVHGQRCASLRCLATGNIPEGLGREWTIALGIGGLSCLYLLAFRRFTGLNPDEGISLQAAERILHGQLPYQDFFSFITPGSYYWTALLLKSFSNSILVARTALVVYGGVFSAITYLIARRVCSRRNAALGACLLTITALPYYFVFEHNWDSTLWTCLALYCAVRFLERPLVAWAFSTGLCASLTCMFEQSKGGGLILGLALGFLLVTYKSEGGNLLMRKPLAAAVLGLALPIATTFIYFGARHGLLSMLTDWLWPLQHYSSVNRVRYGFLPLTSSEWHALHSGPVAWRLFACVSLSPCVLVPVLPLLAVLVLGRQLYQSRREPLRDEQAHYILVSSCITGLLLSVLVARSGLSHIMYLAPIFYLVLCWLFETEAFGGTVLPFLRRAVIAYVLLSFAAFGVAMLLKAGSANHLLLTRRGTLRTSWPDGVISYVQEHVPAGANIFVYPYQPLYYYLTASNNPTSYDLLYDGFNTPAQFRKATLQLEADHPAVVLFSPSFFADIGLTSFPGTPQSVIARRDPMVDFIGSLYHGCAVLPSAQHVTYVFLVRRGLECPAAPGRPTKH